MKTNFHALPSPIRQPGLSQRTILFQNLLFIALFTATAFALCYYSAKAVKETVNIDLSHQVGEFGLVADDGGRTDVVGYIRDYTSSLNGVHQTLPVDDKIPHYTAFFLNGVPEVGTMVKVLTLRVKYFPKENSWWDFSIVY